VKLLPRVWCLVFLTHGVETSNNYKQYMDYQIAAISIVFNHVRGFSPIQISLSDVIFVLFCSSLQNFD